MWRGRLWRCGREAERISGDQLKAGVTSDARNAEAVAATRGAEVDELQARLSYQLALAEIGRITGSTAGDFSRALKRVPRSWDAAE